MKKCCHIFHRAYSICRNLTKTSFTFGSFLYLIDESESDFVKPSKPVRETVSLKNPETMQLLTLIAVDKIMTKSMIMMMMMVMMVMINYYYQSINQSIFISGVSP